MKNLDKEEIDSLLDHNYDGIQEYDNPMPKWWLYMFYGTIAFAFLYMGYYFTYENTLETYSGNPDHLVWSGKKLELDIIANTPEDTVQWDAVGATEVAGLIKDKGLINRGKSLFAAKCAACHMANASGGVGPNLTDAYWINGGLTEEIYNTVTNGANNGAMPSWKKELGNKNIVSLVAYLETLRNTNVPGKEPQGEMVE